MIGPALLSLKIAAFSAVIVLPLAVAIAWTLSRVAIPGKSLRSTMVNMPLVLPPVVTGLVLLDALGRGGVAGRQLAPLGISLPCTWWAAVAASVAVSMPLAVWTTKVAFDAIEPGVENAARVAEIVARPHALYLRATLNDRDSLWSHITPAAQQRMDLQVGMDVTLIVRSHAVRVL